MPPDARHAPGAQPGSSPGRGHTRLMRTAVGLAGAGSLALLLAALTGSTPLAVMVVAMAVTGIVLLVRDWRGDRDRPHVPGAQPADDDAGASASEPDLSPDEFSPDISAYPGGPSSDARAD